MQKDIQEVKPKAGIFCNEMIKALFTTECIVNSFQRCEFYKYEQIFKDKSLLKIINNKSLVDTIKSFLDNGLNLTHASEGSYVHRNTMIYRIKKVEKQLGLDVKNFNDAVIFMNVLLVYNKLFQI